MGRIRTIKPEFPQSETVGRLSRDARLLFLQLWTIVDDSGRTRASSRILASLLYPYDHDAFGLINGWLEELEREQCLRRYAVDNNTYLEIFNWAKHQKIDRPTPSRIPPFVESSRDIVESSRNITPDLGPRTLDLGPASAPPLASEEEEKIDASMAVSAVIDMAKLHTIKARICLDSMAKQAEKSGEDMKAWAEKMAKAWQQLEGARSRLEYFWNAETFFGEGHWKNSEGWPWKKDQRTAKKLRPVSE